MTDGPLTPEEIRVLRSILKGLSAAEWRALKALASGIVKGVNGTSPAAPSGPKVATDAELAGRYGDPTVRNKDPKRWAGASYVGANYSRCPTDYLLVLAESLEYFADKDSKKPDAKKHANGTSYWQFDLKNAGLARGWAARNRGKAFAPPSQPGADDGGYSDAAEPPMDDGAEEQWSP